MSVFYSVLCSVLADFISALDKFLSWTNSHVDFHFMIHCTSMVCSTLRVEDLMLSKKLFNIFLARALIFSPSVNVCKGLK